MVAKERLQSPELVVDAIGTGTGDITLGHVRNYIVTELQREKTQTQNDIELTNKYKNDTKKLRELLHTLKSSTVVIQGSRCAACHHSLELPSIHFLCQHSYHQHCFQSYSEHENECPACLPENKTLVELIRARDHNKDLNETFHSQLEKTPDGFSLAAEYFGRGVFNTVTVIREPVASSLSNTQDSSSNPLPSFGERNLQGVSDSFGGRNAQSVDSNFGPGAEARQRQKEGKRNVPIVIPTSEARLRIQENQYSASLEANLTKNYAFDGSPKRMGNADSLAANVKAVGNPFEEEDDPKDSGNPFDTDDDAEDDTNPFKDDMANDDYDKNLNPFAS